MGKNQAYKAMQRARLGSTSAGPEEAEDGLVDGSFHSPEWHAARLASLKTSHTVTWEEYKKKQKEDALRKGELEADADRMMREYRAQLDAERARKLAHGRNHSSSKSSNKKDRKDKGGKKRGSRKRKNRHLLPEKMKGFFDIWLHGMSWELDTEVPKILSSLISMKMLTEAGLLNIDSCSAQDGDPPPTLASPVHPRNRQVAMTMRENQEVQSQSLREIRKRSRNQKTRKKMKVLYHFLDFLRV